MVGETDREDSMPIVDHQGNVILPHPVVQIEQVTETRNVSGTLDYTDFRSVNAVWALIFVGDVGPKPWDGPRPTFRDYQVKHEQLDFHEMFQWVDCTNVWWHHDRLMKPIIDDAEVERLAGLLDEWKAAWASIRETERLEQEAQRLRIEAERRLAWERKEAAQARKLARDATAQAAALGGATLPAKGAEVIAAGRRGQVFWSGVTKHRGKWGARVGVRFARGEQGQFFDLAQITKA